MKKIVVLFSGGPDSTLVVHRYLSEEYSVHALTLVTEPESREAAAARELAKGLPLHHVMIDATWIRQLFSDIPGMTLCVGGDASNGCGVTANSAAPLGIELMHMMAGVYALAHDVPYVAWALQKDEIRNRFDLQQYLAMLSGISLLRTGKRLQIVLPLMELTKAQVLIQLHRFGVSVGRTYSCNNKHSGPCGKCDHCIARCDAETLAFGSSQLANHDASKAKST